MFNSLIASGLGPVNFLICTAASLILGLLVALVFSIRAQFSKSFAITVALVPSIVQLIIMMVSGSIGAGVAVAGTFSLIRFRSEAGTARQIGAIFLAVALGIANAMGYVLLSCIFFVVIAVFYLLLTFLNFGSHAETQRQLRITIPENLDYEGVFDDLFATYTQSHTLDQVKTVNMGTLYELRYTVILKDVTKIKAFMDEIRTRNGNLTVLCGRVQSESEL